MAYDWTAAMARKSNRQTAMRARIAAAAARIMAQDGVDDFALAKRKAARQLGALDTQALPRNDEIEAELRAYRALYHADEHADLIEQLRRVALGAMRALEGFHPYLTGPVLKGTASPYAEIDLQLFPDSAKEVEIFLLDRGISFATHEARRYSGDKAHPVSVITFVWESVPVRLSIFDPRVERLALKTSVAGRVVERANLSEVSALLGSDRVSKRL